MMKCALIVSAAILVIIIAPSTRNDHNDDSGLLVYMHAEERASRVCCAETNDRIDCHFARRWVVTDGGACISPRRLVLVNRQMVVMKQVQVDHSGAVVESDFQPLLPLLPQGARFTVHCPDRLYALLAQLLPRSCTLVSICPGALSDTQRALASSFDQSCKADATLRRAPACPNCSGRCIDQRCGFCLPITTIAGITDLLIAGMYRVAQMIWNAKPWQHLSPQHVGYIVVSSSCDLFVIVGVNAIRVVMSSTKSLCILEFQEPGQGAGRPWREIDYIVGLARSGAPLPLPDPATSVATDPLSQSVLPIFLSRASNNSIATQPTITELEYLQLGVYVVLEVYRAGLFQATDADVGSSARRYARIETNVALPNFIAMRARTGLDSVRVGFPGAVHSRMLAVSSAHTGLLASAFDDTDIVETWGPSRCFELHPRHQQHIQDLLALKLQANALYQARQFSSAHEKYTNALDQYTALCADISPMWKQDTSLLINWLNLLSNRAQSGLQLAFYEGVVTDCTAVIEHWPKPREIVYVSRSLAARARALQRLARLRDALADLAVLRRWAQTGSRFVPSIANLDSRIAEIVLQQQLSEAHVVWRRIPMLAGFRMSGRHGHSTVLHPDQSCLVILGGKRAVADQLFYDCRRVLLFDLSEQKWIPRICTGAIPPPLADHTAVVYDGSMYVLGGVRPDPTGGLTRAGSGSPAFYRLNLSDYVWTSFKYRNQPQGLVRHSAIVHGPSMIVFGGHDLAVNCKLAGVFVFNFVRQDWTTVSPSRKSPSPRCGHMCWISRGRMFVFGGEGATTGDLYAFSIARMRWVGVVDAGAGPPPQPRSRTEAVCFADRAAYLFGGLDDNMALSSDGVRIVHTTGQDGGGVIWRRMTAHGAARPRPRAGCTLTLDPARRRALLIGGCDLNVTPERVYGDVWELFVARAADDATRVLVSCVQCSREGNWKKCARCLVAHYCSPECMKDAWPTHQTSCVAASCPDSPTPPVINIVANK